MPISIPVPPGQTKESFADAIMGLATPTPIGFNLVTKGIKAKGKNILAIDWLDTEKGAGLVDALKELVNRAENTKSNSIIFQPMAGNLSRFIEKMGIPKASEEVVSATKDKWQYLSGRDTYEMPVDMIKKWLDKK